MKILILNWRDPKNPKSGGAESVTMEHAKAWVKAGHSVTWFASSFKGSKKQETISNIDIFRSGNILTIFIHALMFYLFSKQKFDLVIDEIHGLPFFTPFYVRVPKIAFIHEVAGKIWDYMWPFPLNVIGRLSELIIFKPYKNTKFITVSLSTKKDLVRLGIPEKNINIVENGINVKLAKLPLLKEKEPTFVFISRVVRMKGIEDVVRSFFYIARDLKNAKLWIVGDGEKGYVDELREMIDAYSLSAKVKFFGRVSEEAKYELLRKAHILLHASVKEGWGLVVIEAASQATPSVVYDVAGLRDSVRNDVTGIVLKENSCREMAKQAVKLFTDKQRYLTYQQNDLSFAESLSWEKSTQQSLALIKAIVK